MGAVDVPVALLGYAAYQGLVAAPTEATMGDIQRIFYYHVPSAWTGFILFFINFCASIMFLLSNGKSQRQAKADALAVAAAEQLPPLHPGRAHERWIGKLLQNLSLIPLLPCRRSPPF